MSDDSSKSHVYSDSGGAGTFLLSWLRHRGLRRRHEVPCAYPESQGLYPKHARFKYAMPDDRRLNRFSPGRTLAVLSPGVADLSPKA